MLTNDEKALAANAAVLLSKNKVIQAVYDTFGRLAERYQVQAAGLSTDAIRLHPKISKGENYLGLPWVMLDYPRFFSGGEALAIRTLFWWGHAFSLHLLLQGTQMTLLNAVNIPDDWYLSTATDPWQHHFQVETAIPAASLTTEKLQRQATKGFLKLSTYLPVQNWDVSERFLQKKYAEAVNMLQVKPDKSSPCNQPLLIKRRYDEINPSLV